MEVVQTSQGVTVFQVKGNNMTSNATQPYMKATVEKIQQVGNSHKKRNVRLDTYFVYLIINHLIIMFFYGINLWLQCFEITLVTPSHRWVSCGTVWWWWWWAMTQTSLSPSLTCHSDITPSGGRRGSLSSLTSLSANLAAFLTFFPGGTLCYSGCKTRKLTGN